MSETFPVVLTAPLAAERLLTTIDAVAAELDAGRLRGFKVGGEWRTTEQDLLAFMGRPTESQGRVERLVDVSRQVEVAWRKVESFSFKWPARAGHNPKDSTESHDLAYTATLPWQGREVQLTVGFAKRYAAGMNRRRVNVFLSRGSLLPLVEFVGANDYETTGRLASVMKHKEGRHVRPGEQVPEEYRDMPRCVYSDVVVGPNAAGSIAVAAYRNELHVMARHGLIRASWKGLI